MKRGTIVRNMCQPSRESLLVYIGTSGKYANCLWFIDGSFFGKHDFYKNDILHDREHFPIVGYVDYEKVLMDSVRNGLFQKRRGSPNLEKAQAARKEVLIFTAQEISEATGFPTYEQLKEWCEANAEGRLVVLPCEEAEAIIPADPEEANDGS